MPIDRKPNDLPRFNPILCPYTMGSEQGRIPEPVWEQRWLRCKRKVRLVTDKISERFDRLLKTMAAGEPHKAEQREEKVVAKVKPEKPE